MLAVLFAVVASVVWACTRNSDADQKPVSAASSSSALPTVPSETATPTVTESPTPGASSSATPGASDSTGSASPSASRRGGKTLCPTDDVRVSVRADRKFYDPGEQPKFTVIIVNLRKSPCYIDMGKEAAFLKVISGEDRVWSNADCSSRKDRDLRKFASGDVYTSTMTWKRTRSAEGCENTDIEAKPGYYVVDARVGKAKPKDRPVFVLREG